jgi:hypothetical protein
MIARIRESISRCRALRPRATGWSHQETWFLRRPLVPKDQGPKRQDLGSTGPDPREDVPLKGGVPFKGVPFKGWVQGLVVIETGLPPSLSAATRDLIRMLLTMPLRPANPVGNAGPFIRSPVASRVLPGQESRNSRVQTIPARISAAWVWTFTFANACRIVPSGPIT